MLPIITPSVCSLLWACPLGRLSLGSLSYHERRSNNTLEKPHGKRKKRENAPASPCQYSHPVEAEAMEWRSRLGCSSPSGHSWNQRITPLNPGSGAELWKIKPRSYLSHKFWSALLHSKYWDSLKDLMTSTLVTHWFDDGLDSNALGVRDGSKEKHDFIVSITAHLSLLFRQFHTILIWLAY